MTIPAITYGQDEEDKTFVITHYTLEYEVTVGEPFTDILNIPSNGTQEVVTLTETGSIVAGTTYQIEVYSYSEGVSSEDSSPGTVTTG